MPPLTQWIGRLTVWLPGSLLMLALLAAAIAQEQYRIAPGDRISINVYGEPDLSFDDLPIPGSGYITYPFLGQVRAEGRSEVELANDISRGLLDGYLLQPQVSVAVINYRPVFVGGAVRLPGQKEFSIGMDVERLIALSGGFSDYADQSDIIIQRRGESGRFELKADLSRDIMPGDVVTVGEVERVQDVVEYIYLHGEVRSPGRYEYTEGLSVEKAIAIAGGFGLRASARKISISRGEDQPDLERVPLNTPVRPGDVITVGASLF